MRTTFEKNLQLFHVPIEELQINEQSRDDIPRLLSGLKALYCDEQSRHAVLAHMEAKHSERASLENGRPGMSFWQVLVLGILKQGLNCDFDRLEEMRRHSDIRIMLQCPDHAQSDGAAQRGDASVRQQENHAARSQARESLQPAARRPKPVPADLRAENETAAEYSRMRFSWHHPELKIRLFDTISGRIFRFYAISYESP